MKRVLFIIVAILSISLLCGCVDRKTPAERSAEAWGEWFKDQVDHIDSYADELNEAHEKAEQDKE
jgi:outer membrane murein-binding lipoprotein Lpp